MAMILGFTKPHDSREEVLHVCLQLILVPYGEVIAVNFLPHGSCLSSRSEISYFLIPHPFPPNLSGAQVLSFVEHTLILLICYNNHMHITNKQTNKCYQLITKS